MRIRTLLAAIVVLALGGSAAPQPPAAGSSKAAEVIAAARKAIGGKKLDALKSFSVQAALQRNVGNFQMNSDVEILLELPDKYLRSETHRAAA